MKYMYTKYLINYIENILKNCSKCFRKLTPSETELFVEDDNACLLVFLGAFFA
jgi:hypothetical protein